MAVFEPTAEPKVTKPKVRKEKTMWWDDLPHPLSDGDFGREFCNHVLATSTDRSLTIVRNRAHRFIRNLMAPELIKALETYRVEHPSAPV